jgi:hypothetical protein
MAAEIGLEIMPKLGDDLASAMRLAERTLGDAGGSIAVVSDTVTESNDAALADFRDKSSVPVYFLAVARSDTPAASTETRQGSFSDRVASNARYPLIPIHWMKRLTLAWTPARKWTKATKVVRSSSLANWIVSR